MKKVFIASLILLFTFMIIDGITHQPHKVNESSEELAGHESKKVHTVQFAF